MLLAALALAALVRDAGALPPSARRDSFFLSSRAQDGLSHLPLAWVRKGRVVHADPLLATWPPNELRSCGDPRRWAVVGSRWYALDAWGQIIGTSRVTEANFYDATGCNELDLEPEYGDETLYVSLDSGWHPEPSAAFTPPAGLVFSFRALTRAALDEPVITEPPGVHPECSSIAERGRFFTSRTGGRYAVGTSNVGYLLAELEGEDWVVKLSETDFKKPDEYTCYRPIAVFDMNHDGVPEVVLRQSTGETWGDFVLGRDRTGKWKVVAMSPGSALV